MVFAGLYGLCMTPPSIVINRPSLVVLIGAIGAECCLLVVAGRWVPILAFFCLVAHATIPADEWDIQNPFSPTSTGVLCIVVSGLFTRRILI